MVLVETCFRMQKHPMGNATNDKYYISFYVLDISSSYEPSKSLHSLPLDALIIFSWFISFVLQHVQSILSMHYSDAHNHNQRDILGFCSIFHWPNSVIKPLLINKAGTIESFSINQVYAMEGYFRKTISHTGHHTQSSLPALLRRASETSSPPWIITHYSMHSCGSRLFWE